ncbi:G-protein coupled receptor family C group 6 member A-like [Xenopus tropicalis]|uniref:G-protein coupled receptor family C group 6 member A-like n=1 Tax=Xenopus tropicalis TaxID=8364 RepID=A0A8J1JPM7_XENTR|nr:G-protein coupled receptor family C group 6 member A-like [Xenopus tropicalis]
MHKLQQMQFPLDLSYNGDLSNGGVTKAISDLFGKCPAPTDATQLWKPGTTPHQGWRLQLRYIVKALSMIYAIERINNSTLLPGIKLGYEIYDSCADVSKAVQSTIKLFPELDSWISLPFCNNTQLTPTVKVVIGESFSELSVAISRILSLYSIPQISTASSAPSLSDKLRFPSFLRTIPSDKHQTQAITKLISTFGWNWVGIIASDDDYGRSAAELLKSYFEKEMICTAFSKTVPSYVDHPSMQEYIDNVISELNISTANAVIVIAKGTIVIKLFQEAIRLNISRTWIATDIWSTSREVLNMKDIDKVGAVFGLMFQAKLVEGFTAYLQNLKPPPNGATNNFLEEYKNIRFGCTKEYRKHLECINSLSKNCSVSDSVKMKSPLACKVENVSLANDDYLVENIEWSTPYRVSLAVAAIGQSLHNILCRNGTCIKNMDLSPAEILKEIRKVQFFYNSDPYTFDENGDFFSGYDIINWHTSLQPPVYRAVGLYNMVTSEIRIDETLLFWNTKGNVIPFSDCAKPCPPGYFKRHSLISCCYQCIPCPEDQFSSETDMSECTKCPVHQWSNNGSSHCENRTVEYFQRSNPLAITLMSFAAFGFLLVLMIGVLFIKYRDTSVIKEAGHNYIYLLFASLLLSLGSTGFFIGQPSNIICKVRQPLYGIGFTICLSCIIIKSLNIFVAIHSTKGGNSVNLIYQPAALLSGLTGFQFCLCLLWNILKSPFVREIYTKPEILILQCDEGSYVAFGMMLGYTGILALTSFFLVFHGKKLQSRYNEAWCIKFNILIFMFVWTIFIPIYINTSDVYQSAVQVIAMLASIYAVIACQILPTSYIILFKRRKIRSTGNTSNLLKISELSLQIKNEAFSPDISQQYSRHNSSLPQSKINFRSTKQTVRRRHKSY